MEKSHCLSSGAKLAKPLACKDATRKLEMCIRSDRSDETGRSLDEGLAMKRLAQRRSEVDRLVILASWPGAMVVADRSSGAISGRSPSWGEARGCEKIQVMSWGE